MKIKILGTGCAKCKTLEKLTLEVIEKKGIQATITKVEDLAAILKYHLMEHVPIIIADPVGL